jgi:hypothetical protein
MQAEGMAHAGSHDTLAYLINHAEALKRAATVMLAGTSGTTTYEFDNVTKNAIYKTSALTGWKFAIAFGVTSEEAD